MLMIKLNATLKAVLKSKVLAKKKKKKKNTRKQAHQDDSSNDTKRYNKILLKVLMKSVLFFNGESITFECKISHTCTGKNNKTRIYNTLCHTNHIKTMFCSFNSNAE